MDALGSIVFLALFTAIPILMVGIIAYRVVRWAIVRSGWRGMLKEQGWSADVARDVVLDALEDTGLPTKRAKLSWLATREGAYVALYHRRPKGGRGVGRTRRVLVVPREEAGPCGTLQPRIGGLLEAAALTAAGAFATKCKDFDGWEWALVFPREEAWLAPQKSARLRDFLHPEETLSFGSSWVLLTLREGEMPEVLTRLDELRLAIR